MFSRFVDFSFGFAGAVHLLKNMGLRRQAVSHLQHPSGPVEVSRLLSVSEARVWSVDMEEMSLTEEEGGRLSLLFMAAPALREVTGKTVTTKKRSVATAPSTGRRETTSRCSNIKKYNNDKKTYKYPTGMKAGCLRVESMDWVWI